MNADANLMFWACPSVPFTGIHIEIGQTEVVNLIRLVENIPIARGGWKTYGVEMTAKGAPAGEVTYLAFRMAGQLALKFSWIHPEHSGLLPTGSEHIRR